MTDFLDQPFDLLEQSCKGLVFSGVGTAGIGNQSTTEERSEKISSFQGETACTH